MPANLPQQYRNAEKKYRNCSSIQEELECLKWMLREIPKHKGTDKLRANLKKKISKIKSAIESRGSSGTSAGFKLPWQGAGRVVLIGGPNSGKSQLLATLTDSKPEVADFPFTTRQPLPGLMPFEDVKIQLVDTSPIVSGSYEPHTATLVRSADLVLCLIDLENDDGALFLVDLIKTIQSSRSRIAARAALDETDIGVTYSQAFLVWAKIDADDAHQRQGVFQNILDTQFPDLQLPGFEVSACEKTGLKSLKRAIFNSLDIVRVYTKDPAKKEPDLDHPLTLARGSEVIELAGLLHQELAKNFHSARVWSTDKHDGTVVNSNYVLNDRDIIEIKSR